MLLFDVEMQELEKAFVGACCSAAYPEPCRSLGVLHSFLPGMLEVWNCKGHAASKKLHTQHDVLTVDEMM